MRNRFVVNDYEACTREGLSNAVKRVALKACGLTGVAIVKPLQEDGRLYKRADGMAVRVLVREEEDGFFYALVQGQSAFAQAVYNAISKSPIWITDIDY